MSSDAPATGLLPSGAWPSEDSGYQAHCRRVACWADDVAEELRFTLEERKVLRAAALAHGDHDTSFADNVLESSLDEAGIAIKQPLRLRPGTPKPGQVLKFFHQPAPGASGRAAEMARVLTIANHFDEQLELGRFTETDLDDVLSETAQTEGVLSCTLKHLRERLRKATKTDLFQVMPRMPVYPVVVLKLTRLLANDDVGVRELERVAKDDQVISGRLVQMANSALYSPTIPIRTLAQAIAYLGLDNAKRALLACGMQRLYAHSRLYAIWQHSIEAAQIAERIAVISGKASPCEAFLLGLLHDVGELAVSLMREEVHLGMLRLRSNGCDRALAETLVCGFDHTEAGMEILRQWKFADDLTTAVRYHHAPQKTNSVSASILYLTEFWTDSDEDLPSSARLAAALQNTGLTLERLEAEIPKGNRPLAALS